MTDEQSSANEAGPFSSPDAEWAHQEGETFNAPGSVEEVRSQGAFALDVARIWIQEHQKASMVGAFAVGVFLGSLFRE